MLNKQPIFNDITMTCNFKRDNGHKLLTNVNRVLNELFLKLLE